MSVYYSNIRVSFCEQSHTEPVITNEAREQARTGIDAAIRVHQRFRCLYFLCSHS
jgi:hypothetical protein